MSPFCSPFPDYEVTSELASRKDLINYRGHLISFSKLEVLLSRSRPHTDPKSLRQPQLLHP